MSTEISYPNVHVIKHLYWLVIVVMFTRNINISFNILTGEDCCGELEVEGVKYTFLESKDTSAYKCKDNCVYNKMGTQVKYCFGSGSTPAMCTGGTATTQPTQTSTG